VREIRAMVTTLLCHGNSIQGLIMLNLFHRFINDQSGLTAIEYGLIAILIATTLLQMGKAGAELVGANLLVTFQSVAAAF
jgi:pilus assembly protein Flp/PilA